MGVRRIEPGSSTEDGHDHVGSPHREVCGRKLRPVLAGCARLRELRAVRLSGIDTNPPAPALYRHAGFGHVGSWSLGVLAPVYGFDRHPSLEDRTDG